ncbi:MAG: DUF4349 domain-containing protein [Steroidobacteraceae bacterium]
MALITMDRKRLPLLLLLTSLSVASCTRGAPGASAIATVMPSAMLAGRAAQAMRSKESGNTLSREHQVVVEVRERDLDADFRRVADRCNADSADHCTILQSDLSTGDSPAGQIRLRIDPSAVEDLISFASTGGKLVHRSTTVEDLAGAIQDTQTRLEMLANYRKQLLELQAKAGSNIDAAIKIASELSTVQSNLESVMGEAAYQTKRTTTDIVALEFIVPAHSAYWRPIRESLRDFVGNLSTGLSQAITALAYIVPWLLVIIPGLFLLRFLWRRRGP